MGAEDVIKLVKGRVVVGEGCSKEAECGPGGGGVDAFTACILKDDRKRKKSSWLGIRSLTQMLRRAG